MTVILNNFSLFMICNSNNFLGRLVNLCKERLEMEDFRDEVKFGLKFHCFCKWKGGGFIIN